MKLFKFSGISILTVALANACAMVALASPQPTMAISPQTASLEATEAQQFQVTTESGKVALVIWSVSGVVGGNNVVGTVSQAGVYTAPSRPPSTAVVISAIDRNNTQNQASAAVSVLENPDLEQAHELWLAGATEVAKSNGCNPEVVQQLDNETVAEALHLFSLTASKGTCLILAPVSPDPQSAHYSYAWGGKLGDIDIFYISDVSYARIWDAASIEDK